MQTRVSLKKQLLKVQTYFSPAFDGAPDIPAVARVILKDDALAKSHRPSALLNENTCPIMGVRNFGELLITVQPHRIRHLLDRILEDDSKTTVANLSTIERIEPFTEADVLGSSRLDELRRAAQGDRGVKLKLFRHGRAALNQAVDEALARLLENVRPSRVDALDYGRGVTVYRVKGIQSGKLEELSRFVGAQSLSDFPTYRIVRTASLPVRAALGDEFPPPQAGVDYPTVGIVDSGIPPGDQALAPWIVAKHVYVPPGDRDHDHGSFVGGLLVHARRLNQDDPRFPGVSSKIVDVMAVPKSGKISEDELVAILDEVLPKHPDVRIWNLSLATTLPCTDIGFSDLAIKLDDLQDRYNVTFVLAAGNYVVPPFRGWPPGGTLGEADRICAPADSVRGATVASTAHIHRPNSRVQNEQPSPFSRRGPGPVFIPKPELSHYGGNCDHVGQYAQTGVLSFDGKGNVAENIGTSFASPLVATLFANVDGILAPPVSRTLVKALVVHSAMLGSQPVKVDEMRYRGFGIPGDISRVLTCDPWSATLVFEPELISGYEFEKREFPIPAAFRTANGEVRGEFIITLVYDPPLDPSFGAEYCRTNVDVSLGTYDIGDDGKPHHHRQIPPEPRDVNLLYEKHLVEHGFKWSPVKVYRRRIPRGVSGSEWRLRVSIHHRAEFVTTAPQRIALLITLRDPENQGPVYNEVVAAMITAGWASVDLPVRTQVRVGT